MHTCECVFSVTIESPRALPSLLGRVRNICLHTCRVGYSLLVNSVIAVAQYVVPGTYYSVSGSTGQLAAPVAAASTSSSLNRLATKQQTRELALCMP